MVNPSMDPDLYRATLEARITKRTTLSAAELINVLAASYKAGWDDALEARDAEDEERGAPDPTSY